jgi:hypothetical protein
MGMELSCVLDPNDLDADPNLTRNGLKFTRKAPEMGSSLHNEFSYNSQCSMWESSQLSLLEIPLRTNLKGKIHFP